MTYSHAEPDDEALHTKFHTRMLGVLKFPVSHFLSASSKG